MSSSNCGWTIVEGFESDEQYAQLSNRLGEQLRSGLAKEERVSKPYSGVEWEEHWYRCLDTKQTWRLIAPDPPFKGLFKPI